VRLRGVDICGLEWSKTSEGPPGGDGGNIITSVDQAINVWHSTILRVPLNQDFWFGYGNSHGAPASASAYRTFVDNAVTTASNNPI
jgi:hypothetical protein